MERCRPGAAASIQYPLTRLPIRLPRGRFGSELCLARKLSNLISMKGEDILLSTPSTQLVRYHRLRASVPASLWKWKVVSGWQWTRGKEHINCLEMRAILNALRWRLEHQQHLGCRMVHLTDSLVCFQGASSRKLRPTISRINALLLCGNAQLIWACVATDSNPADKPSRWGRFAPSTGMPKRILEAATPEERGKVRRGLGTLRELTVQPSTRKRYDKALQEFLPFSSMRDLTFRRVGPEWTPLFVTIWKSSGPLEKAARRPVIRSLDCKTANPALGIICRELGGSCVHASK